MDYRGDGTRRRYSVELKARAVRMVYQLREETGQQTGSIKRVADQLGCGVESLQGWVKRDEIDCGDRPGETTEEKAQMFATPSFRTGQRTFRSGAYASTTFNVNDFHG